VLNDAFKIAKEFVSAAKRRARVLDYADLEVHALRALEHEEVRAYYREKWRAFLVDKFPRRTCGASTPEAIREAPTISSGPPKLFRFGYLT